MNRTRIRNTAARVGLRLARRCGVQMDFINPGSSAVTVWGLIESSKQSSGLRDGPTDDFDLTVIIPRQTSFPPAAFLPGATIRYVKSTGTEFQIDGIEPDNEDNLQASTWRLKCGRFGETVEIG